jgi:L-lysine 6-transaminase
MTLTEAKASRVFAPDLVHPTLSRHIQMDGFPFVLDMEESKGVHLVDALSGRSFFDFFTFYASNPLGMNHDKLRRNPDFRSRLLDAAINKVSNSDVYTEHMARFMDTFSRVAIPDHFKYAFFISGGALAVENAVKTAFDWKVRKNYLRGYRYDKGLQVLHFEKAFHGRTGYTMSMTNTVPMKVAHFPKFDWPRIISPAANAPLTEEVLLDLEKREVMAVAQAKRHFHDRKDDIAAIIVEPIQGEGGDNHFRPEFLQQLRDLADENEAMLIFDEVQTGVGLTGTFWAHQGLGVKPDIIAFGKKTQVCGILVGERVDEIPDNVFRTSSRINSTWGGNLVDMVRFDRILEVIEEDELVRNAATVGAHLLRCIEALEDRFEMVANPRGRGLMCAFDLPNGSLRGRLREIAYDRGLLILGCGASSIRFRPALTISEADVDEGIALLEESLKQLEQESAG